MARRAEVIETAGDFAKIGKQHFRHVSGREIKFNCMTWRWEAVGSNFPTMTIAAFAVRAEAARD